MFIRQIYIWINGFRYQETDQRPKNFDIIERRTNGQEVMETCM